MVDEKRLSPFPVCLTEGVHTGIHSECHSGQLHRRITGLNTVQGGIDAVDFVKNQPFADPEVKITQIHGNHYRIAT